MTAPKSKAVTLTDLRALDPGAHGWVIGAMSVVLGVGLNLPGRRVRFVVEGWENMPAEPVITVANHTHFMDWVVLRWVCWRRRRPMMNWVKPRSYEDGYGPLFDRSANVPLMSRGYLIAADVREVHGRKPEEREYRALRDHLDSGSALPSKPFFDAIRERPRSILGLAFDPERETWRACVERLYHTMMTETLAHTRALVRRGLDVQIMPQGVTSQRLTKGQPGAVQAAQALGLRVVPIGINGFPQAYGHEGMIPSPGGTVTVRVGEPFEMEPIEGLEPFLPSSERAHAAALRQRTDAVMARVRPLLDPAHQPSGPDEHDVTGVARFI